MVQPILAVQDLIREAQADRIPYSEIKIRFDAINTPTYGDTMAKWIPDFDYAQALMLDALRLHLPAAPKVLDLGAGTGRFSKLILRTFDNSHVTLVDFSGHMLQEAPRKLVNFAGRYTAQVGDFFDGAVNFAEGVFDGVVSVFAICHGRNVQHYRTLYEKIHRWLKPAGLFLCYDHVLGATGSITALNVDGWRKFMELSQTSESAREGIRSTYDEDSPLSLSQHLALLTQAGFEAADVLFKKDIFAIYAGLKAGPD